ncbi:hypothetical protein [Dysosmobacter sp.]|jgi:hypothetical protein|uniref:hypothetical protein n=1 Tax=Dysosmobacter sp. TaxID=2591382 RepID=UPI002D8091E1|nr:hypothetical protein [Dysosmobacter sp.]MCI6055665.1 hypothetical protein [Dysosmobacter sp.]
MTMFAVVFWTLAAGLAGFALDSFVGGGSSFGVIFAVAVAAGFICTFLDRREQ